MLAEGMGGGTQQRWQQSKVLMQRARTLYGCCRMRDTHTGLEIRSARRVAEGIALLGGGEARSETKPKMTDSNEVRIEEEDHRGKGGGV